MKYLLAFYYMQLPSLCCFLHATHGGLSRVYYNMAFTLILVFVHLKQNTKVNVWLMPYLCVSSTKSSTEPTHKSNCWWKMIGFFQSILLHASYFFLVICLGGKSPTNFRKRERNFCVPNWVLCSQSIYYNGNGWQHQYSHMFKRKV